MTSKIDALSQLLDEILDDLSARFIINLPQEELSSVTRICFGLEQAHWFYEDFFRPQHPTLPSVNLRAFTAALFSHCPLLWKFSGQHEAAFDDFLKYKIRVPVRGAIMLNEEMTKCVLVKGWKASAGWGFPRGKIDQQEEDDDCAVREVKEECGFDITSYVRKKDYVDMVMKEQSVRLYIVPGIPLETKFEPQTRKEISKIDWFDLNDLPTYKKITSSDNAQAAKNNKFYMVAPFLGPLRKWIKKNGPAAKAKKSQSAETATPRSSTPLQDVNTARPEDAAILPQAVDASQALKLLLGIADASASQIHDTELSQVIDVSKKSEDSGIDLASLFTKSAIPTDQSIRRNTTTDNSSDTVPMRLLNTSIEASILDQLRPAGAHSQTDYRYHAHVVEHDRIPHRSSPLVPHQQLPPWMSQQPFVQFPQPEPSRFGTDAGSFPAFPMHQHAHMVSNNHVPLPPPNLHILHNNSLQGNIAPGPPGLLPQGSAESTPRKTNPNASALLQLLKPRDKTPSEQFQTASEHSTRVQHSQSRGLPQETEGHRPMQHKQSLLALLKPNAPTQLNTASMASKQPDHHSAPPNIHPRMASDKDAFLLDYLTQAANQGR